MRKSNTFFGISKVCLFSAVLALAGCSGIKPGASGNSSKLVETFYVGAEGVQYFIKPFTFENAESKESLTVDFVFRYRDEIKDTATATISLYSNELVKTFSSVTIENVQNTCNLNQFEILYIESGKKGFHTRFSGKCEMACFAKLFDDGDWKIILNNAEQSLTMNATGKTRKKIEALDESVFAIF